MNIALKNRIIARLIKDYEEYLDLDKNNHAIHKSITDAYEENLAYLQGLHSKEKNESEVSPYKIVSRMVRDYTHKLNLDKEDCVSDTIIQMREENIEFLEDLRAGLNK